MKIILTALDARLAAAWSKFCGDLDGVAVHQGSILDIQCDAVVSPANSFGFMDGGIDALYVDAFGSQIQDRVRRAILTRHYGELLIGQADIVETGQPSPPFLIAAPTMRVPMALGQETISPYLATRAVLRLASHGVFADGPHAGQRIADHLEVLAFPGMGTGVGRVPQKSVQGRFVRPSWNTATVASGFQALGRKPASSTSSCTPTGQRAFSIDRRDYDALRRSGT